MKEQNNETVDNDLLQKLCTGVEILNSVRLSPQPKGLDNNNCISATEEL